jgi:hypothetical protein
MKPVLAALAASLLLVAACGDRPPQPRTDPAAGAGPSAPVQPRPQTGSPSASEKKESSQPVQGQVDTKQGEQRKDFQQQGDGAGPKPGN